MGLTIDIRAVDGGDLVAAVDRAAGIADTVVIGGGDGTINTAVERLLQTERKPLGILPLGTYNHFARDLGLPLDWRAALERIADGKRRRVDVGRVNGRVFVNNASIGMYAEAVHERERLEATLQRRTWLPRFASLMAAMRRFRRLAIEVRTPAGNIHCHSPFVFIGNNEYALSAPGLGSRKSLDSGRLAVHVCHHPRRVAMLSLAVRALLYRVHEDADFDSFRTEAVTIESPRSRLRVAIDGEVVGMEPPLRFRSEPGILEVIGCADDTTA